jgi:D-lactate dehydrogenase (cytochrome)
MNKNLGRIILQSLNSTHNIIFSRQRSTLSIHTTNFLNDLSSSLPHVQLNTNKYDLYSHGKGESYHPSAPPSAILTPKSNEDIVQIIKLCNKYHIPLIPFGTGTSVEGHVSALNPNSVSLDMKEFKFIDNCDSLQDPCIKVGAGVTRLELNERLRHSGMQFMVDPGADASIGGMVG